MSGYSLVLKVKSLEQQLTALGMRWGHAKPGFDQELEFGDMVAIFPLGDELPVYSRTAVLFTGTLDQLQSWLNGITWARNYDMLIKLSSDKKRTRKEQDELNRQLVNRLKDEKIVSIG